MTSKREIMAMARQTEPFEIEQIRDMHAYDEDDLEMMVGQAGIQVPVNVMALQAIQYVCEVEIAVNKPDTRTTGTYQRVLKKTQRYLSDQHLDTMGRM